MVMSHQALPLSTAPDRLCILRLSALGDVCHMVPVVRSIQAQWPGTRITWCVARMEHRLLEGLEGVELVVFDKGRGRRAWTDLRRQLDGRRFDLLLHAQVSLRSNLAALAVRSPLRLGYDKARSRDLHGLFINQRIPPGAGQHVLDSFFSFAETAGVTRRDLRWDIPVPDDARAFAQHHLGGTRPVLLVSPCSSHALRNWRAERYAAVMDHATSSLGLDVVLCGGPSAQERAMADAIVAATSSPVLDLVGKDTLKQLLALLGRATVVLSPDSGPMHMATAVGTPVIGLHAASNPLRSGPYLSQGWCVDRYDDAARRFRGKPAAALPWGTKLEYPGVMDLVTVEDVVERLDAFMADRRSGQAG